MDFAEEISKGSILLGLSLPATAIATLSRYLVLLIKWNRAFNLTAIRDESKLVCYHILDSLSVLPHLQKGSVIDVGSGAGLPGLPIAIAEPAREVRLLDSNNKKVTFLNQAILELALPNATTVDERVENYRSPKTYHNVISRAFSDLADFVTLSGHLCHAEGRLLAMKGLHPHEELARLPKNWIAEDVVSLNVPDLDASRHLVILRSLQSRQSSLLTA